MADTQWPRFQVFQQYKEGQAHQNVGTVHAPDPEMALQNARDVFVRRPDCTSIWVVRADQIFAKTAEELDSWEAEKTVDPRTPTEPYHVFRKLEHWSTHAYAGIIEAATPVRALRSALKVFADRTALVWWVFPSRLVTCSDPEDVESMFQPALDKPFRNQAQYRTVTLMRQVQTSAEHQEDTP